MGIGVLALSNFLRFIFKVFQGLGKSREVDIVMQVRRRQSYIGFEVGEEVVGLKQVRQILFLI